MKNTFLVLVLVPVIAVAFYFLGKKNGSAETKTEIVQQVGIVKQIAELASLTVAGATNIKVANKTREGTWDIFRDYFNENTLMLSVPFDAKIRCRPQPSENETGYKRKSSGAVPAGLYIIKFANTAG